MPQIDNLDPAPLSREEEAELYHPAINVELGYHPFVESEFEQGAGRCDKCGGGPLAEIHQKPVDQMARIADALERIADRLDEIADVALSVVDTSDDARAVNVRVERV